MELNKMALSRIGKSIGFKITLKEVTANTTIEATENAMIAGPITVASGVTLTVNSGGRLVVV
tara:strand:- start:90 stop:275 length:186 start_codon:yes stop_codon:yes gene_type:complete